MNLRLNFFVGVGTGIMVASVLLWVLQVSAVNHSEVQIKALQNKLSRLGLKDGQLKHQLQLLENVAVPPAKQNAVSTHIGKTKDMTKAGNGSASSFDVNGEKLVTVVIVPGMTDTQIASKLMNKGVIPATGPFIVAAIYYNKFLLAGKYTFRVNEPLSQILYTMAAN